MRWVVGGSLLAVISVAAPQARAQETDPATASNFEAWQIVAEAQLARVIAVEPAMTVRDYAPVEDTSEADSRLAVRTEPPQSAQKTDEPAAIKVAASTTPVEGKLATAALPETPPAGSNPAPGTSTTAAIPVSATGSIALPPLPRMRPADAPPPPAVNSREDICNTLADSAQRHNLPLAFFGNLIYQESGLKPRVVSHVGARGIAQFMPGTARMVGLKNPFNPREALPASAKFLRSLLRTFDNNYGLAAAAYNAGPGKVSRWLKRRTVLPKETRDYVKTITGQGAEHWRGIRGNRFGHRLARRMPCSNMAQFAHANEETVYEKDVLHAVYMKLPRPHPLRLAGKFASVTPMQISLVSSANAAPTAIPAVTDIAPAPAAIAAVETPAPTSVPLKKDEDRIAEPAPAPQTTAVASATESIAMPRASVTSSEQTTGTVTTVTKATPAPQPKPEKIASVQPAEKHEAAKPIATASKFVAPLPRANPLREARLAEKRAEKDKRDDKAGKKADKSDKKNRQDRNADKQDLRKKRRA